MPTPSLVLVVGAGASAEVGLPVGAQLKEELARVLDIRYDHGRQMISGDATINEAYRRLATRGNHQAPDINPYLRAGWRIRDAMPQAISIDHFIDAHKDDELIAHCAKFGIARCILEAERNSLLYVDDSNIYNKVDFSRISDTWYARFFQLLTENCQAVNLEKRLANVGIIAFNYDRCIEHYLHSALQNYYAMEPQSAAAALSGLKIYHPYGRVGPLEWQDASNGHRFGAIPNANTLVSLLDSLRTFTEGINPAESQIDNIRSLLRSADRLVFLGFAFHRLNLELLFPARGDDSTARSAQVFGTAYGISSTDVVEISEHLRRFTEAPKANINLRNDLLCATLFSEFWRSLGLA